MTTVFLLDTCAAMYLVAQEPMAQVATEAMDKAADLGIPLRVSPITAWAKGLRSVPLWIIHGLNDTDAPIKDSEKLVQSIARSGGHPRFTPLADRDHSILDFYDKDEVFDWMTEHQR